MTTVPSRKTTTTNNGITISKVGVISLVLAWCASLHIAYNRGSQLLTSGVFSTATSVVALRNDEAGNRTATVAAAKCSCPPTSQQDEIAASTVSTSLAYQQSYGFFDDITDDDWRLRQTRARQHRHYHGRTPQYLWNQNDPASVLFFSGYEPLFSCPHLLRVGGPGDGPKWNCDPHRLAKVVARRNETCLVYSIGSRGKYMWEDGLYDLLGPNVCEFHVFDPGHYDRPDVNAKRHIHYHQWGITSSYHNDMRSRVVDRGGATITNGDFKTLPETLAALGHENRTIDLLKADCEYCEWFCYHDWITYGDVRQLMIETHHAPLPVTTPGAWPWPGTNLTPFQFFADLQSANYIMFSKDPNIHPKNQGNLVEWSFIKLHPDFLHGT